MIRTLFEINKVIIDKKASKSKLWMEGVVGFSVIPGFMFF